MLRRFAVMNYCALGTLASVFIQLLQLSDIPVCFFESFMVCLLMKTRRTSAEPPKITAGVRTRRTARISSPSARIQNDAQLDENVSAQSVSLTVEKVDEPSSKFRQGGQKVSLKDVWTADDRRLFFLGVRLYGRNFNELTRFIRSRGHRTDTCSSSATANQPPTADAPKASSQSIGPTVVGSVAAAAGLLPSNPPNQSGIQSAAMEGRTKEQVRLLYQQTWHKLRRYIKCPNYVPQHVREVYAIINWSVMRFRVKKTLDNRLGEKLNELVHYGSTCVKHKGRRFLLRTPVCPILKQLNHISEFLLEACVNRIITVRPEWDALVHTPTQEFTLPEDVWVELVPATQMVAWRVLQAEQNPRLRLKTDINRQLSDIISLAEAKWILPTDLIRFLLCASVQSKPEEKGSVSEKLLLRLQRENRVDGAISLQEVSRTRSTDIALNAYLARHQASQEVPKHTDAKETAGEDAPGASSTTSATIATADISKAPAQEGQRHLVPSRAGGSVSSGNSAAVRLDLRGVGRQLANGVTFEEARGIKLVVIYLALGCPARIRFEYDFVQSNSTRATTSSFPISLPKEAIANGEGITNGLRRLLHLSASEYLNLKSWNEPVRPTVTTTVQANTTESTSASRSSGRRMKAPTTPKSTVAVSAPLLEAGSSTKSPARAAVKKPKTEFSTPASHVPGGHEIILVGEGQKQKTKMVVARQLNVQRPVVPLPSTIGDAGLTIPLRSPSSPRPILPLPVPKVPIPPLHSAAAAAASLPVCKAAAPPPTTSLHALRAFSQNQARRVRRHRMAMGALRRRKFVPALPTQQDPPPPPLLASVAESSTEQNVSSHFAQSVAVINPVADMPVTGAPVLSSQSNQGEISLPFSIDACSNVSTSDSLKSLLNAFMANAPPGLDLGTPTKEAPQPLTSPNFFHFAPETQSTTDVVHQEDSSSFSTFINTLTANQPTTSHPVESLSLTDSLQQKIYRDMLQSSGTSMLDLPLHSELPVSGGGDATHLSVENRRGMEMVKIDEAQSTSQEQCLQQQQLREEEHQNLLQMSREKQVKPTNDEALRDRFFETFMSDLSEST
ncbi:Protein cramped-like [Taenia solium]|eukprot:TsM_000290900 transcript=TsM_000290900 gene=TsM_000290900